MNEMLGMQCMGDANPEGAGVAGNMQAVMVAQQQHDYQAEQHKNLQLPANAGQMMHNNALHVHPAPQMQCPPLMQQDDGAQNTMVYYSNQVNMGTHESPSHVSCDSPAHMAYNPMAHMTHNAPLHVSHNSPNQLTHDSPVQWQHNSPVHMPCNSPVHMPCNNNMHMAHNSPVHGTCNSPVACSNSNLHLPHNSPAHDSSAAQVAGPPTNPANETAHQPNYMPTLAEPCKFCGIELPMDTLAVVAHFNSHFRDAPSSCSYDSHAAANRTSHSPHFSAMHKYNMNANRLVNSMAPSDHQNQTSDSHHLYSVPYSYSPQAEPSNLKLYEDQRPGGVEPLTSTLQTPKAAPNLSPGMCGTSTADPSHVAVNRCSPLNLTGRTKLSSSPAAVPPLLDTPSVNEGLYMHGASSSVQMPVMHNNALPNQLMNTNTGPYHGIYSSPNTYFGHGCQYNNSVAMQPQSSNCKVQQSFSHNLENVGLSIPVLSPNLGGVDDEQNCLTSRVRIPDAGPNSIGAYNNVTSSDFVASGVSVMQCKEQTSLIINESIPNDSTNSLSNSANLANSSVKQDEVSNKLCVDSVDSSKSHPVPQENENKDDCNTQNSIPSVVMNSDSLQSCETSGVANCSLASSSNPDTSLPVDVNSKMVNHNFNHPPNEIQNRTCLNTQPTSSFVMNNFPSSISSLIPTYPTLSPQVPFSTDQINVSSSNSPASQYYSLSNPMYAAGTSVSMSWSPNVATPVLSSAGSVPQSVNTATGTCTTNGTSGACTTNGTSGTCTANGTLGVCTTNGGMTAPFLNTPIVVPSLPCPPPAAAPKPYKCSICNEEFNIKEDLRAHFQAHEAAKPFHCDVCGLGVCNQKALKRHKLTHTGYKPYKCDTCGRSFLQKHDLNRHMSIHDRPKYLQCEHCKRTFTGISPLKTHKCKGVKVEMPYLCHICGDGCSNRLSWSYHMWKHTKNPMFVPFQENVSPVGTS